MSSRILVIDDDSFNLDLFNTLLQSDGYEVVSSQVALDHGLSLMNQPAARSEWQYQGLTFLLPLLLPLFHTTSPAKYPPER
jgi:CheY-like chemotaxis protein